MSSPYIDSPRLLPRCDRQQFIEICRHRGWPLRTTIALDFDRGVPATLVFRQGSRAGEEELVHWVEDILVRFPYLVFSGPDAEARARDLQADTGALTSTEVFGFWDAETDPQRLGVLAFYLGVMAPPAPEPGYRDRILAALNHPDRHVRACGLGAIVYRAWPGWEPDMTRLAASDPDDGIRSLAEQLLRERTPP